jgi:DNA-binding HxlR family transcriptional regulator
MIPLAKRQQAGSDQKAGDSTGFRPLPSNGLCTRLGDKWTVQVVWRLSLADGQRLRFSELKGEVGEITQRMLTLTLRNLERDGLVKRHYFPEVPPRVEYSLTEMGNGVLQALETLNFWIRDNLPRVEAARRLYDDGTSDTH